MPWSELGMISGVTLSQNEVNLTWKVSIVHAFACENCNLHLLIWNILKINMYELSVKLHSINV